MSKHRTTHDDTRLNVACDRTRRNFTPCGASSVEVSADMGNVRMPQEGLWSTTGLGNQASGCNVPVGIGLTEAVCGTVFF
jgi:hypothetical protein